MGVDRPGDAMTSAKKPRQPGSGRKSLSGAGASPVLRVRVSAEMLARTEETAAKAGRSVADWVRGLISAAL